MGNGPPLLQANKEVLNGMACLVKVHVVFTLLLVVLREEMSTCLPTRQQWLNHSAISILGLADNNHFALIARQQSIRILPVRRLLGYEMKASGLSLRVR